MLRGSDKFDFVNDCIRRRIGQCNVSEEMYSNFHRERLCWSRAANEVLPGESVDAQSPGLQRGHYQRHATPHSNTKNRQNVCMIKGLSEFW